MNILFISLPFALLLYKLKWTVEGLLEAFVIVAVVQSVFAVVMLLIPSFKDFVTLDLLDLQFMFDKKEYLLFFRIYGLSSEYLFTYPIFQGFVLMIIFTMVAQGVYKYVWFVPLIIISIVFNARIGIVAIPIILFVYFVFALRKSDAFVNLSKFFKTFSVVLLAVLLLVINVSLFIDPEIFTYMVLRGLEENSTGANHWDNLFERMLVLPSSIGGIFFGEGRYLYGNVYDVQSDIGYINDLLFGGVFYIVFYFSMLYYLFRKKYHSFTRIQRVLFSAVFLYIILCNYKGPLLVNNGFLRAVFIILFLHILMSKNESKSLSYYSDSVV
ncbi:hypothetical protein [Mongoliitalea daihaiensis]|uniref:hypothetical protein n=1 Tax=Mongoliitalea daihaiensis TaxID=2782006 RepID=UPI001F2F07B6|nr:hypothetical protein [Mongoliitalea daihaiensis]UJP63384.1 hypothetical protein IPZ59_11040 [Mongoliitalea daihaiensis]